MPPDTLGCSIRQRRTAAYTLVETLVVITILTFMLTSIAMAIGTLFRAQRSLEDDLRRANQLARLDAQLRSDAHQAVSAEQPDAATIVLHLRTLRVRYVVEPNRIVRSLRREEEVVHREVFSLAAKTTVRWAIRVDGDAATSAAAVLSAMVTYEPEDPAKGMVVDRLDAAIGLHSRAIE